jgi:protoheme ferro-lyase
MIKIIMGLRHGIISESKAEKLAKEYTSLMDIQSIDEFFSTLAQKINSFSEMLDIYIQSANDYFNQKTEEFLSNGRSYMKSSQYDKAVNALKGISMIGGKIYE